MEYLMKQKRDKLEVEAEHLYGGDILLKTAYICSKMGTSKEEIEEVSAFLRKESEDLASEIEMKMLYTYDLSGNIILVNPPKEDGIEIKISD